jgi:elongator complex protein 6
MSTELLTVRDAILNAISVNASSRLSASNDSTVQPHNHDKSRRKILLILDAPTLLLALQSPAPSKPSSASTTLQALIFSLRQHEAVHSTIINLFADISPPSSTLPLNHTPSLLETENRAFLISMAHQSDLIIGCRGLDTGGAGDVSGVLRITRGEVDDGEEDTGQKSEWKEQELLYLVRNDGTAKVWERGAGVG